MSGNSWVTLATNDSYSLGALVLGRSLRRTGTVHQLTVMITPGVTSAMRNLLSSVYNVIEEVNILDSKDAKNLALMTRPELGVTFTKLHCWRLTQFSKCVFLDADILVLKNCDELFEREELSAAPDVGWPDCFNSGVFVYRPSLKTYDDIINFALTQGSFDGGDQGLLNQFFSDWATKDISRHLPFIYNMCSSATYTYLPAFKQYGKDVKIVHFIGPSKPWLQYLDTETRQVKPSPGSEHLHELLQLWWDIFCNEIHTGLSSDMAGLAGAFSKLTLGVPRSPEQIALEEHIRKQAWEHGNIDYLGRDSFDNIWRKICETLAEAPQAEPPPEQSETSGALAHTVPPEVLSASDTQHSTVSSLLEPHSIASVKEPCGADSSTSVEPSSKPCPVTGSAESSEVVTALVEPDVLSTPAPDLAPSTIVLPTPADSTEATLPEALLTVAMPPQAADATHISQTESAETLCALPIEAPTTVPVSAPGAPVFPSGQPVLTASFVTTVSQDNEDDATTMPKVPPSISPQCIVAAPVLVADPLVTKTNQTATLEMALASSTSETPTSPAVVTTASTALPQPTFETPESQPTEDKSVTSTVEDPISQPETIPISSIVEAVFQSATSTLADTMPSSRVESSQVVERTSVPSLVEAPAPQGPAVQVPTSTSIEAVSVADVQISQPVDVQSSSPALEISSSQSDEATSTTGIAVPDTTLISPEQTEVFIVQSSENTVSNLEKVAVSVSDMPVSQSFQSVEQEVIVPEMPTIPASDIPVSQSFQSVEQEVIVPEMPTIPANLASQTSEGQSDTVSEIPFSYESLESMISQHANQTQLLPAAHSEPVSPRESDSIDSGAKSQLPVQPEKVVSSSDLPDFTTRLSDLVPSPPPSPGTESAVTAAFATDVQPIVLSSAIQDNVLSTDTTSNMQVPADAQSVNTVVGQGVIVTQPTPPLSPADSSVQSPLPQSTSQALAVVSDIPETPPVISDPSGVVSITPTAPDSTASTPASASSPQELPEQSEATGQTSSDPKAPIPPKRRHKQPQITEQASGGKPTKPMKPQKGKK